MVVATLRVVGLGAGVGDGEGEGEAVGFVVGVGDAVADGLAVGLEEGVTVGVGVGEGVERSWSRSWLRTLVLCVRICCVCAYSRDNYNNEYDCCYCCCFHFFHCFPVSRCAYLSISIGFSLKTNIQAANYFFSPVNSLKITIASPSGIPSRLASSTAETSPFRGKMLSRVYALCVGYITEAWTASTTNCQSCSFEYSSKIIGINH